MNPKFYDPNKVGQLFAPRMPDVMMEAKALGAGYVKSNGPSVLLLLVDPQVDFIHTNGALSVPGAIDDTRRTIEWIYRNLLQVKNIAASLDTHLPFQIFHPAWWVDQNGQNPMPFTPITLADFNSKKWRPVARGQQDWSRKYLEKLEMNSKKTLMIWPYHCLLGSPGHAIEPSLMEAIMYHSAARFSQPKWLVKGDIPETENYSILEPEVPVGTHPHGGLNTTFLRDLEQYDLIYIAGQAKSHCVLETVVSLIRYFDAQAPGVIARLRILMDCISSVGGAGSQFDLDANKAFAEFEANYGLISRTSMDSIG